MTRVLHTGDTHLGYRQYNEPARRQDFLRAFRRVAADAVESEVDAVVHAGDLFHDRRPELPDLLGTIGVLRTLADADIPFLAVVGNHETKRDAQWLDLFESLGYAERLGSEPRVVGDVALYGLDFVPRSRREDLDYAFADHDADHAALVTHGLFQPFDHGNWDAREVLAGSDVAFDAMLLGDDHEGKRERLTDEADGYDAWVTYCGSTERASASERDDRGYNLVAFDGAGADGVHVTRRSIPTREFVFVDVELADGQGVERVNEQVTQYDLTDAVAVVTIEGEGERIAPAQVEERMREGGALVARVNDRREFEAPDRDLEVSFADPDEAVAERVRELGLSQAARGLDETVRASKTADANVTETVEERVRTLIDEGDEAAFRSAPDIDEGTAERTGTAAERLSADGEDGTEVDDATGDTGAAGDGPAGEGTAAATADPDGGTDAETGTAPGTEGGAEADDAPDDGQGSLGDFA